MTGEYFDKFALAIGEAHVPIAIPSPLPAGSEVRAIRKDGEEVKATTHEDMKTDLSASLAEVKKLKDAFKDESSFSLAKTLGYDERSIFVAVMEGGSPRILQFSVEDAGVKSVNDITATYEYWQQDVNKDKLPYVSGTYQPNLAMIAPPGQKGHVAFSSKDGYGKDIYEEFKKGKIAYLRALKPNAEGFAASCKKASLKESANCLSGTSSDEFGADPSASGSADYADSDAYCNYAAKTVEHNPKICCKSGFSYDGKCAEKIMSSEANKRCILTAEGDVVYVPFEASASGVVSAKAANISKLDVDAIADFSKVAVKGTCPSGDSNCQACFVGKKCDQATDEKSCLNRNTAKAFGASTDEKTTSYLLNPKLRCVYDYRWFNECTPCGFWSQRELRDDIVCKGTGSVNFDTCYQSSIVGFITAGGGISAAALVGVNAVPVAGQIASAVVIVGGVITSFAQNVMPESEKKNFREICTPNGYYPDATAVEMSCSDNSFSRNNKNGENFAARLAVGRTVIVGTHIFSGPVIGNNNYLEACTQAESALSGCFGIKDIELESYKNRFQKVFGAPYCADNEDQAKPSDKCEGRKAPEKASARTEEEQATADATGQCQENVATKDSCQAKDGCYWHSKDDVGHFCIACSNNAYKDVDGNTYSQDCTSCQDQYASQSGRDACCSIYTTQDSCENQQCNWDTSGIPKCVYSP